MRFIGVDLAWQCEKNHTGAAVLEGGEKGASLLAVSRDLASLDAVTGFIVSHAADGAVVAIDAPLIVRNLTGQRPCETEIARRFGRYKASAHTSNLTRYPAPGGVRLAGALRSHGFSGDVSPSTDRLRHGKWFFEVYPHPAMVVLFDLPERLRYKKGRVAEKRAGLGRYCDLIRTKLTGADPPLQSNQDLESLLNEPLEGLRGRALKRHEDRIDAVFCAYLALHYWRWGDERNEMIGDLADGYIMVPRRNSN